MCYISPPSYLYDTTDYEGLWNCTRTTSPQLRGIP
jgi:hypothetical protein